MFAGREAGVGDLRAAGRCDASRATGRRQIGLEMSQSVGRLDGGRSLGVAVLVVACVTVVKAVCAWELPDHDW